MPYILRMTHTVRGKQKLLARVARPGPSTVVEASESEKQQNRDLRLAAVRALGNFQHYQATEALVVVLEKDKDVALHDRL